MASLKKCIEQHCKNCTYDNTQPGTWREQVEQCTVKSCALWLVRPVSTATINLNRNHRVSVDDNIDVEALVDGLDDETVTA